MAQLNKFLNYIIFLGVVALSSFYFYQLKSSETVQPHRRQTSSIAPGQRYSADVDPQDLANKYLQEAQQALMTEKLKAEINIKKALSETEQLKSSKSVVETDPTKVPVDQQIWKDPANQEDSMVISRPLHSPSPSPESALDKQEYIRQFKENARKNGYEITVNDDLEVTSVVPLRKPQNSKNDYDVESYDNED